MSRMEQLHQLREKSPNDPFLSYGIALEHKKAGEPQQAIEWLDKTIGYDKNYCYAYYQKGQILESMGQGDAARKAYLEGINIAKEIGDAHAWGEIQGALDMMG